MELTSYQKEFLTHLISIRSTGADPEEGAPYGKYPREALDYFLKEAEKAGFRTGVTGDRAGWVEFGSGDKLIGIICHLDVVPAGEGWNSDPFTLTFSDGPDGQIMTGRGIVDDKGPASASFFAMKELLDAGRIPDEYRIRLILGTDEERGCSCIEYYVKHEEIPVFAITPDSEFPAIYCEKGILQVKLNGRNIDGFTANGGSAPNMVPATAKCSVGIDELLVTGKPAHAARPEQGINAISLLCDAIESFGYDLNDYPVMKFVKDFDNNTFTGCDYEDESGALTSNIGLLNADDSSSSLVIDFRVPYTYSFDDLLKVLRTKASKYGLDVEILTSMEHIYIDKNSPSMQKLTDIWKRHIDRFTGFKEEYREQYTEAIAVGGGTYARHIPNTVAFGVQIPWAEDQCHQANESIPVSDFLQWVEIIREFVEDYL